MTLLIVGVVAFVGLHLIPYFATGFRTGLVTKIGIGGYRGFFAVAVLVSMATIIFGWRSTPPEMTFNPPAWGFHVTPLFVLFGFILFFASQAPTNIKRMIRHPQMTGILLWSVGHLAANGEDRSVVLFGGFALWSALAIFGANRRDKIWQKPEKQPILKDVVTVAIGLAVYALAVYFHEAVIGVRPMP